VSAAVIDSRRSDLIISLADIRSRLEVAARSVGRDPHEVTFVAVTKAFPVDDAVTLVSLGVRDLGESRDQEAKAKAAALAVWAGSNGLGLPRWHFLGRLQTNKCRSVAKYAYAVHSVDRAEVVDALADGVVRVDRDPLPVFVQLSLDEDPERGGVEAGALSALADRVAQRPELHLAGVMAIAPLGAEPAEAFARLAESSARLRQAYPSASAISAGMSQDFEAAIRQGATHVRVGSALLGRRRPIFG
jgi:PLP dependent protein